MRVRSFLARVPGGRLGASLHHKAHAFKACRTRELSAKQKFTRDHLCKQVPPVCGDVLKVFVHVCRVRMARVNKNF